MAARLTHARPWMPVAALLVALVTAAALAIGAARVVAQDATPMAGETGMAAHPAHIHTGTCDNLGDVVFPLTPVSAMGMTDAAAGEASTMASEATPVEGGTAAEATPMAGEMMGPEPAVMVETSTSTVDAALADIIEGGHAINVHESEANVENYIACGEIGGMVMTGPGMEEGGTLAVALQELNGSGYSGIAVLEGMGDQTEVVIYLAQGLTGGTGDTTEASPAAVGEPAAAGGEVAVDIKDFTYSPDPVMIAVGGTVTWTNQDSVPHTATAQNRDALQSGRSTRAAATARPSRRPAPTSTSASFTRT